MTVDAYTTTSRRAFLASAAAGATTTVAVATPAWSLDMDAFINQELAADNNKAQLSEDAALCKYGSPSPETGEACRRAGLSTTRKGVDAFGKADRGDFVRCKQFYELDDKGNYVKKTACDGPR
eukprot:scaffold2330_cov153-Amphora_coffeaeformis.AAC.1